MLTTMKKYLVALLMVTATGVSAETATAVPPETLKASSEASDAWVAVIDQDKFDEAWDKGSTTLKLKVPQKSWTAILNATRKPLGKVSSRKLVDQRVAQNPPGLPAGDYMVFIYKTDFSGKKELNEIVTLIQESDGKWRGLTYQVQ